MTTGGRQRGRKERVFPSGPFISLEQSSGEQRVRSWSAILTPSLKPYMKINIYMTPTDFCLHGPSQRPVPTSELHFYCIRATQVARSHPLRVFLVNNRLHICANPFKRDYLAIHFQTRVRYTHAAVTRKRGRFTEEERKKGRRRRAGVLSEC